MELGQFDHKYAVAWDLQAFTLEQSDELVGVVLGERRHAGLVADCQVNLVLVLEGLDDSVTVVVGQPVLVDLEVGGVLVDGRSSDGQSVVVEQQLLEFINFQLGELDALALVAGQQLEGLVRVARADVLLRVVEDREGLLDDAALLELAETARVQQLGAVLLLRHVVRHTDRGLQSVDEEVHGECVLGLSDD